MKKILIASVLGITAYFSNVSAGVQKFYIKGQPLYEFTNVCASGPITVNIPGIGTIKAICSEALFQAAKLNGQKSLAIQAAQQIDIAARDSSMVQTIQQSANTPFQQLSKPVQQLWHDMKLYAMYAIVKAKFEQNPRLLALLANTNDDELIEDAAVDCIWGNGISSGNQGLPPQGTPGTNWLGKVLMKVRKDLYGNPYPASLAAGTTGTIAQFETALTTHKTAWLAANNNQEITGVATAPNLRVPLGVQRGREDEDNEDEDELRTMRRHRTEAAAARSTQATMCIGCHQRPTFNGKPGEYCGQTCRTFHLQQAAQVTTAARSTQAPMCIGCGKRPTFNGQPGEYCGRTCRNINLQQATAARSTQAPMCIGCRQRPTFNGQPGEYCGRTCRNAHLKK